MVKLKVIDLLKVTLTPTTNPNPNPTTTTTNPNPYYYYPGTIEKINRKFQSKSPQVRAFLVKRMHFKRVPQVTFKSYYPTLNPNANV